MGARARGKLAFKINVDGEGLRGPESPSRAIQKKKINNARRIRVSSANKVAPKEADECLFTAPTMGALVIAAG